MPLPNYLPCISGGGDEAEYDNNRKTYIVKYFHQGCSYTDILAFLLLYHNIHISLATLKRDLVALGLSKRSIVEDRDEIKQLVEEELAGSGSNLGKFCV